jgi:hypothetical protein
MAAMRRPREPVRPRPNRWRIVFILVQNLRQTVERELSLRRTHLRVRAHGNARREPQWLAPLTSSPVSAPPNARERMLLPARRLAINTEIARQERQSKQDLFARFKELQAARLPISEIARQLGLNRRRLDKWATLSELPERKKMVPHPGSVETFGEYLGKRWQVGYRNGRILFDEIQALGFVGTHKTLDKFLSPWRRGNVAFETSAQSTQSKSITPVPSTTPPLPDPTQHRQISPQIAAALLAKPRLQLTGRQAEIVDALNSGCPGYASMRSLMLGFRSLMRQPKEGSSQTIRDSFAFTPLDRASGRDRNRLDPEFRLPIATGHSGSGGGRHGKVEQRRCRGPGESAQNIEEADVR